MTTIPEPYIGYNALISYLTERSNKSYLNFLLISDTIIASSSAYNLTSWSALDELWYTRFLKEARTIDPNNFLMLKEKVCLLFCKNRVTLNQAMFCLGELLGMTPLVTTPRLYLGILSLSLARVCFFWRRD